MTSGTTKTNKRLATFRERKDAYFAHGEHSPLEPEQRDEFRGLAYFPDNPALALALTPDESGPGIGERLTLATKNGEPQAFIRSGRVTFEVDGTPVTLSVFKDVARGRHFLPFRDRTAGVETYPVGRYLDPQMRPDGTLVVDFNYAYNPYCAYSDGWACPIPPAENIIPVRIEAGERLFPRASSFTAADRDRSTESHGSDRA